MKASEKRGGGRKKKKAEKEKERSAWVCPGPVTDQAPAHLPQSQSVSAEWL